MRTKFWIWLVASLFAVFTASMASANPPNDCGPNDIYGSSQYCGQYQESNGGTLICICNGGEVCVDPNTNIQNPTQVVNGQTVAAPGVCTTGSSFTCDDSFNPRLICEGDSQCGGSSCCIPHACPAFVCGPAEDGCGGNEMCATAPGCQGETIAISNGNSPGSPIGIVENTTFTLTNGPAHLPPNFPKTFTIWLTQPNGAVVQLNQAWQHFDINGNCSGTLAGNGVFAGGGPGMWRMYVTQRAPNAWGFTQSNTLTFEVVTP